MLLASAGLAHDPHHDFVQIGAGGVEGVDAAHQSRTNPEEILTRGLLGRLYQVKQRGWRQERQLARRMENGLLQGMNLPRRIEWYVAEKAQERASGPREALAQ